MSHHRPASAVQDYVQRLERVLSCVGRGNNVVVDGFSPGVAHAAAPMQPITLSSGHSLEVQEWFRVQRNNEGRASYLVVQIGYAYYLTSGDSELLAYHLHPEGRSGYRRPHLHARLDTLGSRGLHLPTGHVPLEDIIFFLITDLGARPLRDDWQAVLAASRTRIREWSIWS